MAVLFLIDNNKIMLYYLYRGKTMLFGKGFNIFKLIGIIISIAIVAILIFKGNISEAIGR